MRVVVGAHVVREQPGALLVVAEGDGVVFEDVIVCVRADEEHPEGRTDPRINIVVVVVAMAAEVRLHARAIREEVVVGAVVGTTVVLSEASAQRIAYASEERCHGSGDQS